MKLVSKACCIASLGLYVGCAYELLSRSQHLSDVCATILCSGMDCPRVRYPQLNDVVEADLAEQGYQVLTDAGQQVDKVIQLYEVSLHAPCCVIRLSVVPGTEDCMC